MKKIRNNGATPQKTAFGSTLGLMLLFFSIFLLPGLTLGCSQGSRAKDGEIAVHYLDVGQSDCAFIELFGRYTVLVDCSDQEHSADVCRYVRDLGYSRVDVMVISHCHSDHAGGASDVLKSIEVGKVYVAEPEERSLIYEELTSSAEERGVQVSSVVHGGEFTFGGAVCTFLSDPQRRFENENDTSTVLRVSYGQRAFLFMGDCESDAEEALLGGSYDLRADVVKVGHHGSSGASSDQLIRATGASVAVVSCSLDNEYGHPSPYAIDRWRDWGADVFVTAVHSTVTVRTDGNEMYVSCSGGAEPYPAHSDSLDGSVRVWVLNTQSHTVHKRSCVYAKKISRENVDYSSADIERLAAEGYEKCKYCFD